MSVDEAKVDFDELNPANLNPPPSKPFMERIKLPLTKDGHSHKKTRRLMRAHRNGGNIRAILKPTGKVNR